jgi:hypothetical protein
MRDFVSAAVCAAGIAFAASAIWLSIRIVNNTKRRRTRLWVALGVVAFIPLVYILSYGPCMWFCVWKLENIGYLDGGGFYGPPFWIASGNGPRWLSAPYNAYLNWWIFLGTGV